MYSSKEGDIVLDPFLGSGQVAVVSKMLNRQYVWFEIVKEYYEFAKERLEKIFIELKKWGILKLKYDKVNLFLKGSKNGS